MPIYLCLSDSIYIHISDSQAQLWIAAPIIVVSDHTHMRICATSDNNVIWQRRSHVSFFRLLYFPHTLSSCARCKHLISQTAVWQNDGSSVRGDWCNIYLLWQRWQIPIWHKWHIRCKHEDVVSWMQKKKSALSNSYNNKSFHMKEIIWDEPHSAASWLHPYYTVFVFRWNDRQPDERFSSVSELMSIHTNRPENAYQVTIHIHWARACRCKQEADLSSLQSVA